MAYTETTNYGLKKGSGGSGQTIEQQRVYDNENADTIDATMKATNDAIGSRHYTEQNYVDNDEDVTNSLDALDIVLKDANDAIDNAQVEVDALENLVSTNTADILTKADQSEVDITTTVLFWTLNPVRNAVVFQIKMSAGLMDFSITGAENLTWHFPDGTTSNVTRPAKTLAAAGMVYATCTNFSKDLIEVTDSGTNGLFVGDLADLPALTYYLSLYGCTLVTGDLADLPALTYYLDLSSCALITGDLSDLPALTYFLSLYGCTLVTGDLADLPALTCYLSLYGCALITGDLSDLPALTYYLSLSNCTLVTGIYSAVSGSNVPTLTYLSNTGLSSADMDGTLIAYAACTKNNGSFTAVGMTRTAASDTAVATLTGRGWTISGITKV